LYLKQNATLDVAAERYRKRGHLFLHRKRAFSLIDTRICVSASRIPKETFLLYISRPRTRVAEGNPEDSERLLLRRIQTRNSVNFAPEIFPLKFSKKDFRFSGFQEIFRNSAGDFLRQTSPIKESGFGSRTSVALGSLDHSACAIGDVHPFDYLENYLERDITVGINYELNKCDAFVHRLTAPVSDSIVLSRIHSRVHESRDDVARSSRAR